MIIGKYVRALLDERKRVVLPGFGNLEVKMPEGAESPSGNRIDPPGTSVKFDSGFSKDDGLIAGAIVAGEGMDADEARQRVLEMVDAIKFALDRGDSYYLPDTGTFKRDEDAKVGFKTEPTWVLEPGQFGLESMDLLELEDIPTTKEPEAVKEEKEQSEETAATDTTEAEQDSKADTAPEVKPEDANADTKPEAETETKTEVKPPETPPARPPARPAPRPAPSVTPLATHEPKAKPRRWRVVWIVAALLIVILAVLILIPSELTNGGGGTLKFLHKRPKKEVVQPVSTSPSETDVAGTEEEAAEVEEELVNETPVKVEEPHPYFIIAGSFKNLGNASDLQDKLNGRGYTAEVMMTENRMYRVSVASFATQTEAERALAQIKAEPGLESVWLLVN
jgi:cell division septation protein DedD